MRPECAVGALDCGCSGGGRRGGGEVPCGGSQPVAAKEADHG